MLETDRGTGGCPCGRYPLRYRHSTAVLRDSTAIQSDSTAVQRDSTVILSEAKNLSEKELKQQEKERKRAIKEAERARKEAERKARWEEQDRKDAEKRAAKEAKRIVINTIQRTATETAIENAVTTFPIDNDEIKGRIIGREGRNIRALEAATGVEIVVDDTPEAIVISAFDPVRREVCRLALHQLQCCFCLKNRTGQPF